MKYLNASSGLNQCSSTCPCPWCNIKQADFLKAKDELPYWQVRDLITQIKMSHSFVDGLVDEDRYKCPGCGEIVSKEDPLE